jgi:pimeloyl-ACP methyl ester carboxylesterase
MARSGRPASRRFRPQAPPLGLAGTVALASAAVVGVAAGLSALKAYRFGRRAERRHPPTGRFLQAAGVRLHVVERGRRDGPTLVFLHGNGAMAEDLVASGLADELEDEFRLVAVDRPGFGYSVRPRSRIWTAETQAEVIADALGQLGVEEAVVLGHSWGNLPAVALALNHPERVAGLVLLSGYFFPSTRLDVWLLSGPAIPGVGDVQRYVGWPAIRAITPKLVQRIFEPQPVPPAFRQRFPLELSLRPWQLRASAADTALMIPSAAALCSRYGEIEQPTILLAGDEDRVVDLGRQAERMVQSLPDAELRVLPGLGHMAHYFETRAVAEAVRDVAARTGAMSPGTRLEASPGIEPGCKDLQSSA